MDVFCPHCLHRVPLTTERPGVYPLKCPECRQESIVTIPENPTDQVVARPKKSSASTETARPQVRRLVDAPPGRPARPPAEKSGNDAVPVARCWIVPDGDEAIPARSASRPSSVGSNRRANRPAIDGPQDDDEEIPVASVVEEEEAGFDELESPPADDASYVPAQIKKPKSKPSSKRAPIAESGGRGRGRGRGKDSGHSDILVGSLIAGGIWIVLVALSVFVRPIAIVLVVSGGLATFLGRRMFLQVAREEGIGTLWACRLIPFYAVYFFCTHVETTLRYFLLAACGYVFFWTGMVFVIVHRIEQQGFFPNRAPVFAKNAADEDDEDAADEKEAQQAIAVALQQPRQPGINARPARRIAAPVPKEEDGAEASVPGHEPDRPRPKAEPGVLLTVEGEETPLAITVMNYYHIKQGRANVADTFELNGAGSSIRGAFPAGFDGNWEEIVGKPLTLLARSSEPDDGDSEIKLGKNGVIKVKGGSLTIEQVVSSKPKAVLRGRIQLQTAGLEGDQTLNGTFEVSVTDLQ